MAWLEAFDDSLKRVRDHQAIHTLVIGEIHLHRTWLTIHAARGAIDLDFQEGLHIDPYVPHLVSLRSHPELIRVVPFYLLGSFKLHLISFGGVIDEETIQVRFHRCRI